MFRSIAFCLAAAVSVCSCSQSHDSASEVKTKRDAKTALTDTTPLATFIATATGVLAGESHSGAIPVSQFLDLMPLSGSDRAVLGAAFPLSFATTCNGQICSAVTEGTAATATLLASVKINFLVTITNPTLMLADKVTADFVIRGDHGVEFCNVAGFSVEKLGVTQVIHGLYDRIEPNKPKLTIGDDENDYSCL